METSWRRLKDVFRLCLQKTSSKRIQDVLIKTNIFALVIPFQKTSSRPLQDILLDKTNIFVLAIRLQGVFKTFLGRLQDVLQKRLQVIFKTYSRRFSTHLQDVLQIHLQDVFKTYHQVKLFLLTRRREVFNTFLRRTPKTVIYRGVFPGHTTSQKFMGSVQNLQER